MAKLISFKDLYPVEYRPGEDELTNYRAYRRKRLGEETQKEGLFDRVGDKVAKAKRAIANGMPKHVAMAKYLVTSKELGEACWDNYKQVGMKKKGDKMVPDCVPEAKNAAQQAAIAISKKEKNEDVDEALNMSQRLARRRMFKRIQPKIKIGREKAKRRIASKEKLNKRSMKKARKMIFMKLTKNIPKADLSFARRQEIEKRLDSPAMKRRIATIARKMLPKVRQAELQKKRTG